ncbi:MAG TPA: flagellar hook-basal body complex protein FliE [Feifaniaceae bacterium]|nr:flagellar hook-basal body complex protein FliE [Feifaniaceae bacterium]
MQIQQLSNIVTQGQQASSAAKPEGSAFPDILSNAIQEARSADTTTQADTLNLLSGDITDLHTATIQAQKAELSLNLAIQIRNKVIDAYNEVMRMQV